jgi:outer membrane protein assembly factor BamA
MRRNKYENKPVIRTIEIVALMFTLFLVAASPGLLAADESNINLSSLNLTIDDIVCRNNENTRCSFIAKKYYQKVGELVEPDEIADAKLRLGTLRQFRDVRIVLEKGAKRGHVVVVIIVEEADQVQFNIATNYSGRNDENTRADRFNTSFGVTDFNFLGSGKQLDLNITSRFSDSKQKQTVGDITGNNIIFISNDSESDNYSASLSYLDPHLFESEKYYFNARIAYDVSQSSGISTILHPDYSRRDEYRLDDKSSFLNLGFGKRFGRNSYLLLDAYTVRSRSDQLPTRSDSRVSFGYGWDSRDDFIFATTGSSFSAFVSGLNDSEYKSLSLNYQENIALSDEWVFNYSLGNSFAYVKGRGTDGVFNPYSTLTLSDIDSRDGKNGNFSGWKYSIQVPLKDTSIEDVGFGASYIVQTDKLLLRFSLFYQSDWGG